MIPEPLRSLRKFLREVTKAEEDAHITGGEILFGSITHDGTKTLSILARETDRFVGTVRKFVIGDETERKLYRRRHK